MMLFSQGKDALRRRLNEAKGGPEPVAGSMTAFHLQLRIPLLNTIWALRHPGCNSKAGVYPGKPQAREASSPTPLHTQEMASP